MRPPRCHRCGSEMAPDGPGQLDQVGGSLPAERFRCPKCPEPVIATLAIPGATFRVDEMPKTGGAT